MHRALEVFHRWLALTVGLILIVVAITGAAVVFEGPIANAHAIRVTPGTQRLPLDSLVALAVTSAGGGQVVAIGAGGEPDRAYEFSVVAGDSDRDVALNPYTGALLPAPTGPSAAEAFVHQLHVVHVSLLAGPTGRRVVGVVTVAALLLVLTGLILWWRDKLWRIQWSASWKRVVFDLHHALGVVAAIVLLVILGTGIWMSYGATIDPLVLSLNRTPFSPRPPKQPPHDSGAVPATLGAVLRAAQAAVPGAPLMFMQAPPDGPVRVVMRYPEDHTPGGRSFAFVDRYRGTVLKSFSTRTAELGSSLMAHQRSLHTGDILGAPTQVIWFLAALILASQGVTGVLMWWNARAARKAQRRAASSAG